MSKIQNPKQKPARTKKYDLEDRTYNFAKKCRDFINQLPKTLTSIEYSKQLVRTSGSQAANYIEANECLSRKDFSHRIKICRKEAKESRLWLRLCQVGKDEILEKMQIELVQEASELTKIFGSILEKCK